MMRAQTIEHTLVRHGCHRTSRLSNQLHSSLADGNPPQAGIEEVLLAPAPLAPEPALADPVPLPDPDEPDVLAPDPLPIVP
jgi:hypothetical protein